MQANYTYYLKLADKYYLLETDDLVVLKYFENEFVGLKNNYKTGLKLKIKKINGGHIITNKKEKIYKKTLITDLQSINYLEYVDFAVMLLINNNSVSDNTFLLHGAAYTKNNQGYIFLGPPGAGKSTITRQVPKGHLYADDTVVVKKTKNKFFLYPSPFDKKKMEVSNLKPVPVKRIYILNQARNNDIFNLKIEKKISLVLQRTLSIEGNFLVKNINKKKLYQLVLDLISKVSIHRLLFTKNFNPYKNLS